MKYVRVVVKGVTVWRTKVRADVVVNEDWLKEVKPLLAAMPHKLIVD